MPMIDIYAAVGTFADTKKLATDAATLVKSVEQVPDIPMFRENTAAFVHEMPLTALSNVDGDGTYVRVQVLTNAGAFDRQKELTLVEKLTELIAAAGWGLWGHAQTNDELVAAARAEIGRLRPG